MTAFARALARTNLFPRAAFKGVELCQSAGAVNLGAVTTSDATTAPRGSESRGAVWGAVRTNR
jgi:hypothetical protein